MCGGSSESRSSNATTSSQTTGGSGADSTTVTAGGNVSVETGGREITLSALEGMGDVVRMALDNVGAATASQAAATAAQADNSTQLLSTILQTNAQLAQNSQTGGATAAISQTNKIIWGLIGLAGLGLGLVLWKRKSA